MAIYFTKCNRKFDKISTSSVTGYHIKEDDLQCNGDSANGKEPCPFRKEVTKGWPPIFDHWECRAGSKKPNHKNEWGGSLEDKNSIYVKSLNHNFLESVLEYCNNHPELSGSYNQDLNDCRRIISIQCSANKKGIAAKKELVERFYNELAGKIPEVHVPEEVRMMENPKEGEVMSEFLEDEKKCVSKKVECGYYCKHNEGCALLIVTGGAFDMIIKGIGPVECDTYRNIFKSPVKNSRYELVNEQYVEVSETLDDKLGAIKNSVGNIINNYIQIGFMLLEIRNTKIYETKGYSNLIECVESELGMKKSTCYNLMKIAEMFGDADTKLLKSDYRQFGYVQLLEMTTMSEEQISQVNPEMSKREIKEIKNSNRMEKSTEPELQQVNINNLGNGNIIDVDFSYVDEFEGSDTSECISLKKNKVIDLPKDVNEAALKKNTHFQQESSYTEEVPEQITGQIDVNEVIKSNDEDLIREIERLESEMFLLRGIKDGLYSLVHEIDNNFAKLSKTQIRNALNDFLISGKITFED